ncbi:MAG TPA: chemotaxis protein CheW [Frateuria sp.]|uniref:chemotaxis protein CheW n=1 Tax=Frateuria sp. TaxID=2211372 RepID=UPI002DF682D4|nr:chemotaxis protein CheW [Frateuria sp.]
MTSPATPSTAPHWLTFQLDGQAYAAPLAQVSEVIRMAEVTPVPGAAADLLGVRHLRGRVVPVLDGRRRLGLPPCDADSEGVRVVMLTHATHWIGLRVDAVGELLVPDAAVAAPPPGRAARTDDPVTGVLPWKGGFVALLDVRRLCRLPQTETA